MSFTPTGDAARSSQPRGPAQVDVFTTGRPARPHVELGTIESKQDNPTAHDEAIEKMREYAAQLGCDALVIDAGTGMSGSCLVYTSPPSMQPPPAAAANSGPSSCIPNAPQPCFGAGGCRGNQLCSGDGKSFTPCDCAASGAQQP